MLTRSWLILLVLTSSLHADGGTLRLSTTCNGLEIAAFTSPALLQAGPVDVSVLIQDAATHHPLEAVAVTIHAWPQGRLEEKISSLATHAAATNKLFRASQLSLPEQGAWTIEIEIKQDGKASFKVAFDVDIAPPPPPWLDLGLWIGWPFAALALFALHRLLATARHPRLAQPPA